MKPHSEDLLPGSGARERSALVSHIVYIRYFEPSLNDTKLRVLGIKINRSRNWFVEM